MLHLSDDKAADFFENASIAMHCVGPDGTILRANRAELEMLGYPHDEYIGRHIAEFHADRAVIDDILRRLKRGETLRDWPARLRHKDGSIRNVRINSSALFEDGEFIHTRCITIDVTEQQKAEDALWESERRFRSLADAAPVLIWMSGPDKEGIYFNQTWLDFTGLAIEEQLGDRWVELVHPDDREALFAICLEGFRKREPFTAEFRLRRFDGEYRWLLDTGVPRFDASGQFIGFIGSCMDIHDRKQAELSRAALIAIVESTDDAVIGMSPDGTITSWNAAADRIFGYSATEAVGRSVTLIVPPELHDEERKILDRLSRGERIKHFETVRIARDGRRVDIALTISPVRDREGKIIGSSKVARDVTERRKAERALRISDERLRLAQEVAQIGTFEWNVETNGNIWTPELEALYGLEPGTFPGTQADWEALVHPEDRDAAIRLIERSFETCEPTEGEWRVVWPDGSIHWIAGRWQVIKDETGHPVRVTGINIDITERQRLEEERRASDRRYRAIVESQAEMVCRFQPDGTILFANGAYARSRGATPEALVGVNFWQFVKKEDQPHVHAMLDRLRPDTPQIRIENRFETRDGVRWTMWTNCALAFDEHGFPTEVQSTGIDITERKQTEEALRESERQIREVIDALPVAVYTTDADGWVQHFNPAVVELAGRAPRIGSDRWCVTAKLLRTDGSPLSHDVCPMAIALKTGRDVHGEEIIAELPGGTRRCLAAYPTPLRDQSGRIVGGINMLVDITEQKSTEETLARHAKEQSALYQFADRLQRAGSIGQVYDAALDAILSSLNCDRASILLGDDDGVMRFVGSRGLSEEYRNAVEGHSPWKPGDFHAEPICIGDIHEADLPDPLRSVIEAEGIAALAFIPLLGSQGVIGKFMVYFDAPHALDEQELDLSLLIARQLTFNIQRMRADNDQRRTQVALLQSEEQYRRLVGLMPVAMYTCEAPSGRITFYNERAAELWGRSPEPDATDERFCGSFRLWRPDGSLLEHAHTPMAIALRENRSFRNQDVIIERPDGRRINVLVNIDPIRDPLGRVIGAINVFQDITDRRLAESALRDSRERFAQFMQHLPGLAWIKNLDGRYVFANESAAEAFGVSTSELYGKSDAEVFPSGTAVQFSKNDREAVTTGTGIQVVETLEHQGSDVRYSIVNKFPIPGADGRPTLIGGMAIDITDMKRAEEALRLSEIQYRELAGRLKVLLETTSHLIETLETGELLCSLLDLSREIVAADAFGVWRMNEQGDWHLVASCGLSEGFIAETLKSQANTNIPTQPIIIQPEDMNRRDSSLLRDRWKRYEADGIRSLMIFPLRIHGNVTGTLVFYCRTPHAFNEIEVESAQALSNIAAGAITTAELYEAQSSLRRRAEDLAVREAFLAQAGAVLSESLDYEQTLTNVARTAVPHFADWCSVDLFDEDGVLRRLADAHVDPERVKLARVMREKYPPSPNLNAGVLHVVQTRKPELISFISDELLVKAARNDEHLRYLRGLGVVSQICVPLTAGGVVRGAITFVTSESRRQYREEDLMLAQEIARRASQAIDNARLYHDLSESEQRLRLALDAGHMGSWEWAVATNQVVWSSGLEGIHGLQPGGFAGTFEGFRREIHPDDVDKVLKSIERTLASGNDHHVEYRIIRPDGNVRWVEGRGKLYRNPDGVPVRMIGVCADVTDRRQAARKHRAIAELGELALRERDIQALFDRATAMIAETLGVEFTKILKQLPGGNELLLRSGVGWKPGLVNTARVSAKKGSQAGYTLFSNMPVVVANLRKETRFKGPSLLHDHGVVSGMTCVIRSAGGGRPWGVLGAHSTKRIDFRADDVNFLLAAANILGDAIELKQAEHALRASEQQFHQLADSVTQLAWMADPTGHIYWYNQRWYEYTGTTPEDMQGWGWTSVHDPAMLPEVLERWQHSLRTGEPFEMVFPLRSKSGEYGSFLTCATPLKNEAGAVIRWCGTNTDISQQHAVETELRDTAAGLTGLNRRKDQFLATLAHELRNPLAPIRTGLALLSKQPLPDASHQVIDTMAGQMRQLVRLVDDLLDVARISRGKITLRRKVFDVNEAVREAIDATQPFIQEMGHTLDVSHSEEAADVLGDPARLNQVFSNLIHNAAKYTPAGGAIRITVVRHEERVEISIADNGRGISADDLEIIFDLFAQIDSTDSSDRVGLGIGLTMVKSFVEMHGGHVRVTSEGIDRGATFTVTLNLTDETPSNERAGKSEFETLVENIAPPLSVLVVDDNVGAADLMAAAVKSMGHTVKTAYNGREAIEVAADQQPDVVLMDIGMPIMNGHEAVRFMRRQPWGKGMFMIALTGWGQNSDRDQSKDAGFDLHLVKPVEPDDIERLLSKFARDMTRSGNS